MHKIAANMCACFAVKSALWVVSSLMMYSSDVKRGIVSAFQMCLLLQEVKTRAAQKGETGDALMALERRRKPLPAGELQLGTAAKQAI